MVKYGTKVVCLEPTSIYAVSVKLTTAEGKPLPLGSLYERVINHSLADLATEGFVITHLFGMFSVAILIKSECELNARMMVEKVVNVLYYDLKPFAVGLER